MSNVKKREKMTKKIRVLITAASGGSVGEQVLESLKMAKTSYYIITTNVDSNKNGLYEADKGYLVPLASNRNYIPHLLEICQKEKVQVIVPGSAPELEIISEHRDEFKRNNILLLINSSKVIEICQDKLKTMDFLKKQGLL